jgi:hypothetical protein
MRRPLVLICAVAFPLAFSPQASADIFEPIQLVSAGPLGQADYAHHPAISGDGRYVAVDGSFGGLIGVWRRDMLSGAVEAVVTCPRETMPERPCAKLPSISDDGRYVSFTTTLAVDPKSDTNRAPDVYVRDMNSHVPCSAERPPGEECEYALASAKSGSTAALAYTYGASPELEEPSYGSLASGRSALSADGRHVVFVTTAQSDLYRGEATPRLQVAVRDLDAHATRLVSVRYVAERAETTEEPVPNAEKSGLGAVYPGGGNLPAFGSAAVASAGASISGDGSTVAWMGQEIEQQTRVLPGETDVVSPGYTEPLWRRIADGPRAPTRRITGGGDPESGACAASGEQGPAKPPTLADPCQGPFDPTYAQSEAGIFSLGPAVADYLPRLSANGQIVAFLSTAREIAAGEAFTSEPSSDLYIVDMRGGLTRVQSLRRLTELAGGNLNEPGRTAPVVDMGVSPDGTQIAFSTQRTVFPLGSPAFVSAPAAEVGPVELYDVDLANDTLTRVTGGFQGQPSEPASGLTGSPSFSSDGSSLAFGSSIADLVYGDGNAPHGETPGFDGSDAFVVRRKVLSPTPAETYISPAPAGPALAPAWRLGVTAHSRRDGSVLLDVLVPEAGTLTVNASGAVLVSEARASRRTHRRRSKGRIAIRTVASGLLHPSAGGLLELTLKLAPRYASLATRRGGLAATALLSFSAPGHEGAHASLGVSFVRIVKSSRRKAKHARSHGPGARR